MSSFGVGFSELTNSFLAGKQAGEQALSSIQNPDNLKICFLFCTSRHEPEGFFEGVKSVINHCPFMGGFSNGSITNDQFGYDGYQCVVGLLCSDTISVDLFISEGIAFNEFNTGSSLFGQIDREKYKASIPFILLFDAVNREKGYFQMNFGTPLFEGAKQHLEAWPNVAGARLMGDMKFKPTNQWFENRMTHNAAMLAAMNGPVEMETVILQGCSPASAYHKVTKAKDAVILEIDNQPALDFVSNFLGPAVKDDLQKIKFFVTLGKNVGDKWDRNNAHYVNRMCVGIDPANKGLIMAESDMGEGTEIQLMRRGFDLNKIESEISALVTSVKMKNRKPIFAFYFNCAGRATAYSQQNEEDAVYVQYAVKNEFPLLGIYEAGEMAKINEDLEVLDWSGVFCLFSEPKE